MDDYIEPEFSDVDFNETGDRVLDDTGWPITDGDDLDDLI